MTAAFAEEPRRWPPADMALCDRCRMHHHVDDLELVELEDPELWCRDCRAEPSGWAAWR